jgi:hypothetical protein
VEPLDPWRAEAEGRGFRLLDPRGGVARLISAGTFLDLEAAFGRFFSAALITWLEAGEGRFPLTTVGEAIPRPRPPGAAGWVAAKLVALLHRLAPPDALPVPLRQPADLRTLIDKHLGELLAIAGKPVQPEGDPLAWRAEQERRDRRVEKK